MTARVLLYLVPFIPKLPLSPDHPTPSPATQRAACGLLSGCYCPHGQKERETPRVSSATHPSITPSLPHKKKHPPTLTPGYYAIATTDLPGSNLARDGGRGLSASRLQAPAAQTRKSRLPSRLSDVLGLQRLPHMPAKALYSPAEGCHPADRCMFAFLP